MRSIASSMGAQVHSARAGLHSPSGERTFRGAPEIVRQTGAVPKNDLVSYSPVVFSPHHCSSFVTMVGGDLANGRICTRQRRH